ncbi:MAG: hypothetical protein AAF546_12270 [Verrucomicrobiota bacterium]
MNDIDQQLRDYYESQRLPEEKIDEILGSGQTRRSNFRRHWIGLAAAAVIILCLLGVFFLRQWQPSLEIQVADEVLKNHAKQLAPEIHAAGFAEIQAALPRLDFPIVPTQSDILASLVVQGGRYCSIQGELAAQISLLDALGEPCTLYIAPLTESLAQLRPGIYEREKGVVQIWHDQHRIFAIAR